MSFLTPNDLPREGKLRLCAYFMHGVGIAAYLFDLFGFEDFDLWDMPTALANPLSILQGLGGSTASADPRKSVLHLWQDSFGS